jgi:hypothetical protein
VQLPIARVRFVAVSATIPNIEDIAAWLEVPQPGLLVYGEEMRPVGGGLPGLWTIGACCWRTDSLPWR